MIDPDEPVPEIIHGRLNIPPGWTATELTIDRLGSHEAEQDRVIILEPTPIPTT